MAKKTQQPAGPVQVLTGSTFDDVIASKEKMTFVKFFAPWCGHCKAMADTWEQLALDVTHVNIAEVVCTQEENKDICGREKVEGFPTLILYQDGAKMLEYTSSRSLEGFKTFLEAEQKKTAAAESAVLKLDSSNFSRETQEGATFVKFFAPWCGHCKAMAEDWEKLAQKLDDVKIAEVDCTQESSKSVCQTEEVSGFPTIFLYKDGKKLGDEFSGRRNLKGFVEFLHASLTEPEPVVVEPEALKQDRIEL